MDPKQKMSKETLSIVKHITRTVQHAEGSFILYLHKILHIYIHDYMFYALMKLSQCK